jgi:hypothetical protein
MLFNLGFGFVAIYFLATGFLMFALPRKYANLVRWYYRKRGLPEKSASAQKFLRWHYRLSGLALFAFAVISLLERAHIIGRN